MYGPLEDLERRSHFEGSLANGIPREIHSETWHWSYIEGLGCDVFFEFEDSNGDGEYHLIQGKRDLRRRRALVPDCLIERILFP